MQFYWFVLHSMIEFLVYDEITAAMAQRFTETLRAQQKAPVTVRINSYGGDLAAALSMLSAMRGRTVECRVEGIAASAATLLLCGGKSVVHENALVMIHAPWASVTGGAVAMRDAAGGLDRFKDAMLSAYAAKTGLPPAEIEAWFDGRDHWFSAVEAQEFGLIDEILPALAVAARLGNLQIPERFYLMTKSTTPGTGTDTVQAAVAAALAAEKNRRREIRMLAHGSVGASATVRAELDACLDDPTVTPAIASTRILAALGAQCASIGPLADHGGTAPVVTLPAGGLYRDFLQADRIGSTVTPYGGHSSEFVAAATDALALRLGGAVKQPHRAAVDFQGTGLSGLATMCLAGTGQSTFGMSRQTVIKAALTTSDFPDLLGAGSNRALVSRFEALADDHRQICDSGDLADFKPARVVNHSFLPGLELKREGGEIQYGSLTDGAETYQLATYARGLVFTREAMVNDDLGALQALIAASANAAARTERDLVFAILTGNPTLSDSVALFDAAGHGNLDTSHATTDVAGLNAARVLMRKQQDTSGGYVMTLPRFLVVPVALQGTAEQLAASLTYSPAAGASIETPAWIKSLIVVSDPRLDASDPADWYLLSDPTAAPVIRLGYLNGNRAPVTEQEVDFNTKDLRISVLFDVACAAVGYAGAVKMS